MKALPIAVSLAVLAVPLFGSAADDQAKNSNTSSTTLSVEAQQHPVDSPLVRAAKASGRLNKKPTMVITNEMLAKAGGHFTTTTMTTPLPPPPPPAANNLAAQAVAAQKQRVAAIEKAKKAEEAKKVRAAHDAAADIYGENAEERINDPAAQEHALQQSTSTQAPPESKKPPLE